MPNIALLFFFNPYACIDFWQTKLYAVSMYCMHTVWCRFTLAIQKTISLWSSFISTFYLGVTLVFSKSSGCRRACGRLYFLILQLPTAFWRIRMFGPMPCLSRDQLKSLYIRHPSQTCLIRARWVWKESRCTKNEKKKPTLCVCSLQGCLLFLDSRCFTNVYFWTCSVLSFNVLHLPVYSNPREGFTQTH